MSFSNYKIPFKPAKEYSKKVAYFSMEFAIDQALKTYSGGLGFLAGSHMRSAYESKQNLIGIGILWKHGYYDQVRSESQHMSVLFQEKIYNFLEDTGIKFTITINNSPVWVKAYYLAPEVFGSAPMFFLSTDMPENDFLAQTISHKLYDKHVEAKVAQCVLLGIGGAKLLDHLGYNPDLYHFNEAHALSAAFYLYDKFKGDKAKLKEKIVFTTHTPEEAGNEKHDINLLNRMGFFNGIPLDKVRGLGQIEGDVFNHSLVALRIAKLANGVSKIHGEVSREMWGKYDNICDIISITNSQNFNYWTGPLLTRAAEKNDHKKLVSRKTELKQLLFKEVVDQTGKLFDPNALTIVWARRFAGYKRPDLITRDMERFKALVENDEYPVQIIWAGKPYPFDYGAVATFNYLVDLSKQFKRVAVVTGYELELSRLLKGGSDIWLNNPRIPREASGTSGMTAAMNGSVNLSTWDGWIPEFAKNEVNSFTVPPADTNWHISKQDEFDRINILDTIENKIVPLYYDNKDKWLEIVKKNILDVSPAFTSERMVDDYYKLLYK